MLLNVPNNNFQLILISIIHLTPFGLMCCCMGRVFPGECHQVRENPESRNEDDSKHPSEGLPVSSYEVQAWLDVPELSEEHV